MAQQGASDDTRKVVILLDPGRGRRVACESLFTVLALPGPMVACDAVEHASNINDLILLTSVRPWMVLLSVPDANGFGAD